MPFVTTCKRQHVAPFWGLPAAGQVCLDAEAGQLTLTKPVLSQGKKDALKLAVSCVEAVLLPTRPGRSRSSMPAGMTHCHCIVPAIKAIYDRRLVRQEGNIL